MPMVSLRLPDDLLEWSTEYAKSRGVSRTDLLIQGLRQFKTDCERGVPEIRQRAAEQVQRGNGECPKWQGGHVWASPAEDPRRRCIHCGKAGRGDTTKGEDSNLAEQGALRAAFFSTLKAPMENGTGKPEKVRR